MLRFFEIDLKDKSSAIRCHITRHLRSLAYGAVRVGSADIIHLPPRISNFNTVTSLMVRRARTCILYCRFRVQSGMQTAVPSVTERCLFDALHTTTAAKSAISIHCM